MKAVFKREFKAYFNTPMGFVILAIMFFFLGQAFSSIFMADYGVSAYVFSTVNTYAMLVAPLITMRLFSEEQRQKTDQLLYTSPVKIESIVLGKFLAALSLFMLCYSVTIIYEFILMLVTEVNFLRFINCVLGVLLMGASVIAIGAFISSLTESQIIAAVLGIIASLFILMIDFFGTLMGGTVIPAICDFLSFNTRFNTFISGIFDFSNAVFFLSVIVLFLFLTVRSLEKRRYA